jgi:membrane protein DedA with SNARE-associated domain
VADRFLAWLAALPTLPTYLVLMALSALENIFPPVPADVAVALGAFLAQRGEVSAPLLGLLCWLSNTASSVWLYFLARAHGEALFRSGWGRKLLPPPAMAALQEAYDRHGAAGIFVSRFLPGVRAAVTPFAGVVGVPPLRALMPASLASGIWYAFLTALGSALGLNWEGVKRVLDDANQALGWLAAAATLAFALWLLRRARSRAG